MEDILAIIAVLALVVAFSFGLRAFLRYRDEQKAEQQREQEESDKYWAKQWSDKYWAKQRELMKERNKARIESASANIPPMPKVAEPKRVETSTSTTYYAQPVQSSSLLSDIADVAMIANTVRHWNDNSHSEPVREERSVGVSKSESSWGFDDSDSRKSVSDTFSSSSSDSWSSSSSSDSVSSDW